MTDATLVQAGARADLVRLLAACYYEPGPELIEERVFESMQTAAGHLDPELAALVARLAPAYAQQPLDALLIDYTRLFLGPTGALASPYGSVWLSEGKYAELMQDSTLAVSQLFERGGFELDDNFKDLPDHVAAELEFLYLTIFRELQARMSGDAAAQVNWSAMRRTLLDEHLGRWITPFTDAITAGATTDYYRELAAVTSLAIAREQAAAPL